MPGGVVTIVVCVWVVSRKWLRKSGDKRCTFLVQDKVCFSYELVGKYVLFVKQER